MKSPWSSELQSQIDNYQRMGRDLQVLCNKICPKYPLKIEDLYINQMVNVYHSEYTEWNDIKCRIVGLSIKKDGTENITLDDGSGYQYDGWKLENIRI